MTTYQLFLKASGQEVLQAHAKMASGPKWRDGALLLAIFAVGMVACLTTAWLKGYDRTVAIDLGWTALLGGLVTFVVVQQILYAKRGKALNGSAFYASPTPASLGSDGVTLEARHFVWADFTKLRRADGFTWLAFSDAAGILIRDQDVGPNLTPDQLQAMITTWKTGQTQ